VTQKIQVKRRATSTIPDDILTNNKLSWAARVVLGWMLGRSPEFDLRIWYVRKCFVLSDQQWVKIRKEMQEEGFFFQQKDQGENGKFEWTNIVSDQPEFKPSPLKPGDGSPPHGSPPHGNRGDKPVGSNTNLINTTTPPPVVVEIDDFVESAVWATPPTTSEAGFRRAVRQRIGDGGPSPEDQRTLDSWRAWRGQQEAVAEEKERDAQRTKHDQKIRDAHHARLAAAMAFFDGLGETRRGEVLAEFTEHLVAKQQSHVLNSLRRSGTENKMVQIALAEFVATAILCAAAEETA